MNRLTCGEWEIEYDCAATQAACAALGGSCDCTCEDCKIYYSKVPGFPPEVLKLFDSLGIDPLHPIEVTDSLGYIADYLFVGRIPGAISFWYPEVPKRRYWEIWRKRRDWKNFEAQWKQQQAEERRRTYTILPGFSVTFMKDPLYLNIPNLFSENDTVVLELNFKMEEPLCRAHST